MRGQACTGTGWDTVRSTARRVVVPLLAVIALAACVSAYAPRDVASASAYLEAAVDEVEYAAERARETRLTKWGRPKERVDEVMVIRDEAREALAVIREAYAAASAQLAAPRTQTVADDATDGAASADAVALLRSVLARAERNFVTIERTAAELDALNVPGTY